ncbi:MAG: hypothetical protein ACREBG_07480, partial [Pyrinomonadaceae bacterium]
NSRRAKIKIALTLVVAGAIGTTVFAVRGRTWFADVSEAKTSDRVMPRAATASQIPQTPVFAVNRAQLNHHVVRALNALGDRFESQGRARSILAGTFTRRTGGTPVSTPVTLVRECPDKVRFEELTLSGLRVLGHDGTRSWTQGGGLSEEDATLIEELVRDCVEHFVTGQATGDATLHLGDMFRMDDGSDATYAGPFYDILRVDDTFQNSAGTAARPTLYYLNSRSGLPERIVYERQVGGTTVKIEVEFSEWITVTGQKLPRRTAWKKNGVVAGEVVINQAMFVPSAPDGAFIAP